MTTHQKIKVNLVSPAGQSIGEVQLHVDVPVDNENSVYALRARALANRGWRACYVAFSHRGVPLREDLPLDVVGIGDGSSVTVTFDVDSVNVDAADLASLAAEGPVGGNRPLHMACDLLAPHPVLAKILAACPDAAALSGIRNQRPLYCIAKCRDVACVKLIGDACPESAAVKTDGGWMPLHSAAFNDAGEATLLYLLSLHPQAAGEALPGSGVLLPMHLFFNKSRMSMAVLRALEAAYPPAVRAAQADSWTPLTFALARKVPDEAVLFLLEKAPDTAAVATKKDFLPLHYAVSNRAATPAVVRRLLEAHPEGVHALTPTGATALHIAVQTGVDEAVLRLLVDAHPAAVSVANNKGMTPVAFAAENNASVAVMQLLLGALPPGGATALPKCEGATPLLLALRARAEPAIVDLLLDAAPEAVRELSDAGWTCLMTAADNNHPSTMRLLQAWREGAAVKAKDNWCGASAVVLCRRTEDGACLMGRRRDATAASLAAAALARACIPQLSIPRRAPARHAAPAPLPHVAQLPHAHI